MVQIDIQNATSIIKKKGRPRKTPINIIPIISENNEPVEKKKRGRKKKEKVEEEIKPKKKRGRKAAIKYFSSSIRKKIGEALIIYDNDTSVLHLDIKEQNIENDITYDVLKNNKKLYSNILSNRRFDSDDESEINDENDKENITEDDGILGDYIDNDFSLDQDNIELQLSELYEKRLESRILQDNQLIKNLEDLKNDDSLLLKLASESEFLNSSVVDPINKQNEKDKGFINILSDFVDTNNWINNTNIACWWCCHNFDTVPIGLPVDYCKNKFRVKGIFCSFACTIAYGENNKLYNTKTKSMINSLYKKLTGYMSINMKDNSDYKNMIYSDCIKRNLFQGNDELQNEYINSLLSFIETPLIAAPNKCVLKMFGGKLSIQEFRNSTKERKIYKMIEYPMFVSRDYIEEIDIGNLKNVNKTVFTKQHITLNKLDENKLNDAKTRINSNVVITNTGMDKFIKW